MNFEIVLPFTIEFSSKKSLDLQDRKIDMLFIILFQTFYLFSNILWFVLAEVPSNIRSIWAILLIADINIIQILTGAEFKIRA